MVAIRRYYDAIGVFVLALACGLGGGLLRDCVFIQSGPPAAMRTSSYMFAVLAGSVSAILFVSCSLIGPSGMGSVQKVCVMVYPMDKT